MSCESFSFRSEYAGPDRWTADGICGIQPFLVPGKESAHVAPINAYLATGAVISRCVGGVPSKGGQVRDFGE